MFNHMVNHMVSHCTVHHHQNCRWTMPRRTWTYLLLFHWVFDTYFDRHYPSIYESLEEM
jgi:hypothetical protein